MVEAKRFWLLLSFGLPLVVLPGVGERPLSPGQHSSPDAAAPVIPTPAYDVASIAPNRSDNGDSSIWTQDANFTATNASLKALLSSAYGIRDDLIAGLPGWAQSARFDIKAKIVDPDLSALKKLTPEQRRSMLAAVLVDRFHLQVHKETKILPVLDLLVAKTGLKVGQSATSSGESGFHSTETDLTSNAVTLVQFCDWLSGQLKRTVVDKTSLPGRYDFHLKWAAERATMAGPSADPADLGPSLLTALEEQLGLKLESAKGPVVTLVVDHIDPPSAN